MNVQEINTKIADLEKRAKNPNLPASAVTSLNKMITDLKAQIKVEPSKPAEPKAPAPKESLLEYENIVITEIMRVGEMSKTQAENLANSSKAVALTKKGYKDDWAYVLTAKEILKLKDNYSEPKAKAEPKKAEPKAKAEAKYPEDEDDYCDKVIKSAKERRAKAKANAKKRANEPKKTPATKNKEKVEKTVEKVLVNVEKRAEKGQVSRSEIVKLIAEHTEAIKKLNKILAQLK